MAKAWRWAAENQHTIWMWVIGGTASLFFVGGLVYMSWSLSRSDEMRGRTSAIGCETSWRGTTCLCGFRTGRQLFVPTGQLPTETCGEDD